MIIKESLFSIPVYMCSEADFRKKREDKRNKTKKLNKNSFAYKHFGIKPEIKFERDIWKYDKIIGWIEFYLNGQTLKADLWFVNAKRIGIDLRNKKFEYSGKIADVSITHRKSNIEIKEDIKTFFINCQRGSYSKKIKNRFIDTSELYRFVNYLDLKEMIVEISGKHKINKGS